MTTEIPMRPGVAFRAAGDGPGTIEFADGRRFGGVTYHGTVPGTAGDGGPARVHVLSAVYPASPDQIEKRERLPVLAVVPVETRYLRTDRDILFALFALDGAVEGGGDLDPLGTVVVTAHGWVDLGEDGGMAGGGPCLPAAGSDRWIYLDPPAVATLVQWVLRPGGRPHAVVNTGCFSSTPRGRRRPTVNEELAALLAPDGVAVYGPPHAGVVTSATWYGAWRNQFGQQLQDGATAREVPIRFRRIIPPAKVSAKWRGRPPSARGGPPVYGAVVVTNDCALAAELSSFSPDFAEKRPHGIDRSLME